MEWNQPLSAKTAIREPFHLKGEIIQIGAVKLDERLRTLDTFKVMVSPCYYKKMNTRVAELTMISTGDLKYGLPFKKAFEKFISWCGEDYCILTWGWDDIPMLEDNLAIHNMDKSLLPPYYNVQPIFDAQITKTGKQCGLSTAMELVGEPPFEAHDALNDALSTACICRHLNMEEGIRNYTECKRKIGSENRCSQTSYNACKDARHDKAVNTFVCNKCGAEVFCNKWLVNSHDRYLAMAYCSCGEGYFIKLKFHRNEDRTFRVNRSIYVLDEVHKAYFYKKLSEKRKKSNDKCVDGKKKLESV